MNILRIISSPRGNASFSTKLGAAIVAKIEAAHPESSVVTRNLTTAHLPYLEESHITSFFTPKEAHTPELTEAIKHSDEAIQELMDADAIVIEAPLYNFSITATLKTWIDHITRAHKTFTYSANGPVGLVTDKKIYLSIASGGIYSEGPMKDYDFTERYLRTILGFMGMTDMTVFRVEGMNMPELKEAALPKALAKLEEHSF